MCPFHQNFSRENRRRESDACCKVAKEEQAEREGEEKRKRERGDGGENSGLVEKSGRA